MPKMNSSSGRLAVVPWSVVRASVVEVVARGGVSVVVVVCR